MHKHACDKHALVVTTTCSCCHRYSSSCHTFPLPPRPAQPTHPALTHLAPGMRLDLREFELCVILVHGLDLLARGRAHDFDDFYELIHIAVAREEGLAEHELRKDTPKRPRVNRRSVVRGSENQLRRAVVARAAPKTSQGVSLFSKVSGVSLFTVPLLSLYCLFTVPVH